MCQNQHPLSFLALCDDGGYYPIHYLAASGYIDYLNLYLDVIESLNDGKKFINIQDQNVGSTALHFAVQHCKIDCAKALILAGCSLNIQNFEGKTALYIAVEQFKENMDRNAIYEIVKLLLVHGANPNITDESGVSPLHVACSFGIVPLLEILVDNGAWVNMRDEDGETPIFYAIRESKTFVVQRLVEYGVDIDEMNEDDESPLEYCKSIGDENMHNIIIEIIEQKKSASIPRSGFLAQNSRNNNFDRTNRVEGDQMDIDCTNCSLSSSAGSRIKLDFPSSTNYQTI